MLPVGALCFYQAHFGRTVLSKWPFWAHLFYSVFYSVSELRRACFRQARVARAVLPPGALFRAGPFALPPCAPKSHMRPLPHLGFSDTFSKCGLQIATLTSYNFRRTQEPLNAPFLIKMGCFPRDFQEGKRPIKAFGETAH